MSILNRFFGIFCVLASFNGFGRDIQAPFPFQTESTASPACVSRMQQFHNIVDSFFDGVPSDTTMKRNDVIVPFIQTDSVFAPLSSGKKTVKYQAVGSYTQSSDKTYRIYAETDDTDTEIRVSWSSTDFYVSLFSDFESTCSGIGDIGSAFFHISFWDNTTSYTMPLFDSSGPTLPTAANFCSNTADTIASKITNATVSGFSNAGGSQSGTTPTQNDAFKASVLAKTKNATIASLCSIWGY